MKNSRRLYSWVVLCFCIICGSCASHRHETQAVHSPSHFSDPEALHAGDQVIVNITSKTIGIDAPPTVCRIDEQGNLEVLEQLVHVSGLTAAEAGSKIRAVFVPRFYNDLDVLVTGPDDSMQGFVR